MLTKADDFPIHQTPEPIAYAGTDRNFYDRYFFNGYNEDGSVFFAAALGVYPHLNVMDASFCIVYEGVQHNLRASRLLGMERMDTQVGPIEVEVEIPLRSLRVRVLPNEHGIRADIVFHSRAVPIEEPRFIRRIGPRTVMDYTRLTQNGSYDGWIEINGHRIVVSDEHFTGTRDRSWGVRNVGAPDSQPVAPPPAPQFYWLWAPLNFEDRITLYHINADATGAPWNTHAVMAPTTGLAAHHMAACSSQVNFKSGTRHAKSATIHMTDEHGGAYQVALTPHWQFYMQGLGYGHPEWGHGRWKGELAVGYDTLETAAADETEGRLQHIQAFCSAVLTGANGLERKGRGVLEQMVIGPHAPSGFTGLLDRAP